MLRIALLLALLTGCATGYHAMSYTGGFSETRLSENVWKVHFSGNGETSQERAADFALLRASELMLENGYPYFLVGESGSSAATSLSTRSSAIGLTTSVNYKPRSNLVAIGYATNPEGTAFNSSFVSQSIRAKYGIK